MNEAQSIKSAKADLRRRCLVARDELRAAYRSACSDKLLDYIDVFGDVDGKIVSGFLPIRSEIDARPLMRALKARGARLCLPVIVDKTTIEFRAYDHEGDLVDAGFGTKGPPHNAPVLEPDVMIVPLAVFDAYGGRIGYGAGYYDRAISRIRAHVGKSPFTVGVAFALQEVPFVPQDQNDVALERILTHEGVIVLEPRPMSSV